MNTTGHARGTHYQIHFKNTQVMEATLKKQRHQGALIITGPLVSPALTYLSALSGCRVTRTKDAKFAPQRTIQEKNAFIKSMLQQYANVESFQWWCRVLHEFVKEEPLLRLKLHLSVYLDCDLREIPKKNPCAELIRDYACKLFLLKKYWHLPLHENVWTSFYHCIAGNEDCPLAWNESDLELTFRRIINESDGNPPLPKFIIKENDLEDGWRHISHFCHFASNYKIFFNLYIQFIFIINK